VRVRRGVALATGLLGLAACGPGRPVQPLSPVVVEGSRLDLRSLAGEWNGEFRGDSTGRHGTIRFSLAAGRDTAYGRVLMEGPAPPAGCVDPVSTATGRGAGVGYLLRLGRINVSHGSVGGWLEPYTDAIRGCMVDTWFEGQLRGDVLEGVYFSHPADGGSLRLGTWQVRRAR
jgi:hypothetical protein